MCSKTTIVIRFDLLQVCPFVPSFVFAVLFIPSFNVWVVIFMSFHSVWRQNFDKFRDTAPERGPACQIELEFGSVRKKWGMRRKAYWCKGEPGKIYRQTKVKIKHRIEQNDQKLWAVYHNKWDRSELPGSSIYDCFIPVVRFAVWNLSGKNCWLQ